MKKTKSIFVFCSALIMGMSIIGCNSNSISASKQQETAKQSANTPIDVVNQYFALAAKGDYKSAWNLIDPSVEKVAELTGSKAKEKFLALGPAPKLEKAAEGQRIDEFKFYSTQSLQLDVATVNVELSDGKKKAIHLAKDDKGKWRLFWDVYQNDLD